jgi:DNA repair exonuclease SbcCD ATPase subunit
VIKYLLVRNWRGYEKFALEPEPGLTFVVAENGTGKTSLLQAASWALFGDGAALDIPDMLRLNEPDLSVQMSLDVNGQDVTLTRKWSPASRPRESLVAEVDGESRDEASVSNMLAEIAGVSGRVLNRLWFVPEMRLVEEANLFGDIRDHLRHLLGIDSLEAAADRTKRISNSAAKEAGQLKQAERLSQSQRSDAEQQASGLVARLAAIDTRLEQLRTNRGALSTELTSSSAWERYECERSKFSQTQGELTRRAEALGADPSPEAAADELRTTYSRLDHSLASVNARRDLIASIQGQLAAAESTCPVCLQPITAEQAARASETHEHQVEVLATQSAELETRLRSLAERSQQITNLATEMSRLRHPEPPVVPAGRPSPDIQTEIEAVDAEVEQTNRQRGEAAADLRHIEDALKTDELSATAEGQITTLYAAEAFAKVLSEATRATAADRVEQALTPLTEAISKQWQTFFPGKGSPAISGQGGMLLRKGSSQLKHSQFSGGEKVLASLVTRLLFVASSTGLRSIWLDEPLEHLDPVNRVKAARLMVQASQAGNRLEQIVVTTYEEGLARTLASRHDHVRLRYVSTDDLL